jgi:hypothetical protein
MGVSHEPVPAIRWGWGWNAEKSDHHQTQHDTDAHISRPPGIKQSEVHFIAVPNAPSEACEQQK